MKKIITHINPDSDAITSVWLIKKFLLALPTGGPGWKEAQVEFVAASSSTLKNASIDQDPNILYVDVGRGKLDHHQTGEYLSAAQLCWEYIKENRDSQPFSSLEKKALAQLVEVVTQVDNARDLKWKEVNLCRHQFNLHAILFGLKGIGETDEQVMEFGFRALNAVLLNLKNKIKAEEELKKGVEFETPWGKAIGLISGNESVLWRGEAQGYILVLRKDPKTGAVQIYSHWDSNVNLAKVYDKVRELDPESDWFLHATNRLLLNQAAVNPGMNPTKLTLDEVIEVLKKSKKRV